MEPPWFPPELAGPPYYFKHWIWVSIHAITRSNIDLALFLSILFSKFLLNQTKYPENLEYPENLGCHSCVIVAECTRYE